MSCYFPAVVPIVLYNGENNWTAQVHYRDTLQGAEQFGTHVLDFEYILVDVNRQEEEHLLELANLMGAIFLLDQKADYQLLMQRLRRLLRTFRGMTPDEFQLLKNWILFILQRKQPEHYGEITRLVEKARPEEAMEMIYNLEKTLDEEFAKRELEGKLEETRAAIVEFLESRYGECPAGVTATLEGMSDLEQLKKLRREVFQADTLQEAVQAIKRNH